MTHYDCLTQTDQMAIPAYSEKLANAYSVYEVGRRPFVLLNSLRPSDAYMRQ